MCGIAGFIGESKDPKLSSEIIKNLFIQCETRGIDAAGVYGLEKGKNGRIVYHKEPGAASRFVETDIWKQIESINLDLMLVHARGATSGMGTPNVNKNNHPFVSSDKSIGMIHNGRIPHYFYKVLKKKYKVNSDCDSELFLRIFEAGKRYEETEFSDFDKITAARLMGIKDIWTYAKEAHMAVVIGERIEDRRDLWFFRNKYRSLWLVDLRDALGQLFFCSTKEIWSAATQRLNFRLNNKVKLLSLPTDEVWSLQLDGNIDNMSINVFSVVPEGEYRRWQPDETVHIEKGTAISEIVGNGEIHSKNGNGRYRRDKPLLVGTLGGTRSLTLSQQCDRIKNLVSDIETQTQNQLFENSISELEFEEMIATLESLELDVKDILRHAI